LVSDNIRDDATQQQFGVDVGSVADQPDGFWNLLFESLFHLGHGVFEIVGDDVHVADIQAFLRALRVHLNDQSNAFIHGDCHWLGAAHTPQTSGEHKLAFKRGPALLVGERAKRFVGALQDALAADVNPGTGGHLTVHDQALGCQFVEVSLSCPVGHQVGVCDQHPGRVGVRAEDAHGLA